MTFGATPEDLSRGQGRGQACEPIRADPDAIRERISKKDTFVVNVVTSWCPDCTERQKPYLPNFVHRLQEAGIDVLELNVQAQRRVFLSPAHQEVTEAFGGHGFPRTVLVIDGQVVDRDNVEVITLEGLEKLAASFIDRVKV
jgi:thiol-disulfide isomerase/thioredoxin